MRAAVCTRYGPPEVLQIRDVPTPIPGAGDVLIRIHATAVSVSDTYIRSMVPTARLWFRVIARLAMGITKPRRPILGAVLAGEIVQAGRRVTRFQVGDRVYAFTLMRMGCYAEYTCLPETSLLAPAPANLSYEDAAAIPYGGLIALYFMRKANIQPGQSVLVYGASGAIGTAALQLAKHYGAKVTAVCSTANLELVRSLGADTVLDYTSEDSPGDRRFDLVFDAVGRRKSSKLKVACENALTPTGRAMSVDAGRPWPRRGDLDLLRELAESGDLKPVIDRRYALDQIAEAHRYVEQGHKKGNVVVLLSQAA